MRRFRRRHRPAAALLRLLLTVPPALVATAPVVLLAPPASAQPWASESERLAGRQALAAAKAGRWLEADSLALAADPLVRKLVTWLRVQSRNSDATAAEIVRFQDENPDWPFPESITRRAEEALAAGDPDDALALHHFSRRPPRTLEGAQRLADALARAGRSAEAARAIRDGWIDGIADADAERAYLSRNAALLTPEDRWRRFDRLMFARETTSAGRAAAAGLDPARAAIARARLALAADRADADANLPRDAQDIGLAYEYARWLRRRDRDAEAAAAWRAAEPLQRDLSAEQARAIWAERHILSRKLLRLGDPRAAYAVAAGHGQAEPGEPRQDAEFLAGFIALRWLEDPALAQRHFAMVGQDSRSVITRARSAYWQGRALAAAGDAAGAKAQWQESAKLPVAFYGQLAALALGENGAALSARINGVTPPPATKAQADAFAARELARAVLALADLDESQRALIFLLRMEALAPDGTDRLLIARLGELIGRPDHAVWIARRAGASGTILLREGWPTPYPAPPSDAVEPALVHAIARQESNFDPAAVSSANARGLMQLLPTTAQAVARRLGVTHRLAMLTSDPAHNMRLGSAYLAQVLERFGGALPLAAAAYNAGPARVDEWLGTYGDPRTGAVDMIDWMEMLPFGETRNYVQRVIENVAVYRARNPEAAALPHPMTEWLRNQGP